MSNKQKILAAAQKYQKKNQILKAVKEYEKLVELEPKDMRYRQKLAEVLYRCERTEDALTQYETVAKNYVENDFHVKAIAIYKQMQRIAPDSASSYEKLAELNAQAGLVGNAISEYQSLFNLYKKHGDDESAIAVLRKMRDLNESNLDVRAKLVEACVQLDRKDEALEEFQGIVAILQKKKAYDKVLKLYDLFLPVLPQVPEMQTSLASILIEKGEVDKGTTLVQDLLKQKPNDPKLLSLLARGYAKEGDHKSARLTYQQLVRLAPKNLDLRQSYIQSCLEDDQADVALHELEEWKDDFFQAERLEELKDYYERCRDVFPSDRRVLQTLDSIYALTGEGDKLLDIMGKEESTDEDTFVGADDDLLAALEEDASSDLEVDVLSTEEDSPLDQGDSEEEFLSSEDFDEISFEDESPEEDVPSGEEIFDLELELDMDDDPAPDFEKTESPEPATGSAASAEVINLPAFDGGDSETFEFDLSADDAADTASEPADNSFQEEGFGQASTEADAFSASDFSDLMAEIDAEDGQQRAQETEQVPDASSQESNQTIRLEDPLDHDDIQSHYNLGIAYKEMGLIDDAIREFRKIIHDREMFVSNHTLLGVCLAEKGDFAEAEKILRQGLEHTDLTDVQRYSLHFELGLLFEKMGQPADALDSYHSVADYDPHFRDVTDRIEALKQQLDGDGVLRNRVSFV